MNAGRSPAAGPAITIPSEHYALPNDSDVSRSLSRSAPQAEVGVSSQVDAKDDAPDRTGLALRRRTPHLSTPHDR